MLLLCCDRCPTEVPITDPSTRPAGWEPIIPGADLCPVCIAQLKRESLKGVFDLFSAFAGAFGRAAKRVPKKPRRRPKRIKQLRGPIIDAE